MILSPKASSLVVRSELVLPTAPGERQLERQSMQLKDQSIRLACLDTKKERYSDARASDAMFTSFKRAKEVRFGPSLNKQARVVAAATLGSKQAHLPKRRRSHSQKISTEQNVTHTQHTHIHQTMQLAAQ